MTQSGGITKVSATLDRRPASDSNARSEGSVWWSDYGMAALGIARERSREGPCRS
jgi:hypothetical protein